MASQPADPPQTSGLLRLVWWHKESLEFNDAQRKESSELRHLLENIRTIHGIEFEVVSEWTSQEERQIYDTVFLRHSRRLLRQSGNSVKSLRSRSGNIMVQDVFLFYDRDEPVCFFHRPQAKDLLAGMVAQGPSFLNAWMARNADAAASGSKDTEQRLIMDFLRGSAAHGFPGRISQEVPLHVPAETEDPFIKTFANVAQKVVDLVHDHPDGSYDIIEAKLRLNWEAFGQALAYAFLYAKLNGLNETRVHPVVICRQTDEMVQDVCERYGVAVVLVGKSD